VKIALAQINPTIADFSGNLKKIRDFSAKAQKQGASLVVFPEQALSGYPALDLWEDPAFIRENSRAIKKLAAESGELGIIVGFSSFNSAPFGKPIHNSAALLHRGKIKASRHKTLLPTYDVFDEARYFKPARSNPPFKFKGKTIGLTICEDAWFSEKNGNKKLYQTDPIGLQARQGADILINISASPFIRGKNLQRRKIMSAHARKNQLPFFYCNMTGGNDEIVFDGRSCVFDHKGRLIDQAKAFSEDILLVDLENMPPPASPSDMSEIEEIEGALITGIGDYLSKCKISKVFVGLSGGIDSAVVAALAVKALGKDRVTGVSMPSRYSSQGSIVDAKTLAQNLQIRFLSVPISSLHDSYKETLKNFIGGNPEDLWEQNIQARIRGNILMALANKEGGMVLTTGNKSELSVGYCTLYGDMSGGLAPLADVPKETVYQLAQWINREKEIIPLNSIQKAPSAELKPGQKDEDDLPPYPVLDQILKLHIEERLGLDEIAKKGFSKNLVKETLRRIELSEHKRRQAPPSIKISPKAFGVGRRMPIARGTYLDEEL
jgi:NAD+ synthase (glutamine-hydrolysing)